MPIKNPSISTSGTAFIPALSAICAKSEPRKNRILAGSPISATTVSPKKAIRVCSVVSMSGPC